MDHFVLFLHDDLTMAAWYVAISEPSTLQFCDAAPTVTATSHLEYLGLLQLRDLRYMHAGYAAVLLP